MSFFERLFSAATERDLQWDPHKKFDLAFRGLELGGESGELENVLKKLHRERIGAVGSRATIQDAEKEMADVIICVANIGIALGIDPDRMEGIVRDKFNETSRKYGLNARMG